MLTLTLLSTLSAIFSACRAAPADTPGAALPPGQQFPGGADTSKGQLASTTFYGIASGDPMTSCGCSGTWQAPNGGTVLTAAGSFPIEKGWCGTGCGSCFELENTGNPPCPDTGFKGCGGGGHKGERVIVMVTNGCPQTGNEQWCTSPNRHGYKYHFDIAVPAGSKLPGQNGWGNAEVKFVPVSCNVAVNAPGTKMVGNPLQNYGQCRCSKQAPVKTKTVSGARVGGEPASVDGPVSAGPAGIVAVNGTFIQPVVEPPNPDSTS